MDKLTEIMIHKRREIAPLLRPVFTEELAALDRALPRPPAFLPALNRSVLLHDREMTQELSDNPLSTRRFSEYNCINLYNSKTKQEST